MADSDLQLIEMVKNGERSAFSSLVERYKHKAFALCYNITGNYEDAKDILQEALIRVYQSIKGFKGTSSFYTWFYRIVTNLCRDYLRKKSRAERVFVEQSILQNDDEDTETIEAKDPNPNPAQVTVANELKYIIDSAIALLPERQRLAFTLKHIQGMRLDEVAALLKCRPSTVKAHLFKAAQNLQRYLEPCLSSQW